MIKSNDLSQTLLSHLIVRCNFYMTCYTQHVANSQTKPVFFWLNSVPKEVIDVAFISSSSSATFVDVLTSLLPFMLRVNR